MEVAKRKLLEKTHQTILKVGFENNDYEVIADLISPNFVGFGTALDEKIFGIKDLKALLKRQKEQSKGFEMNVALSTLHTHLSINENTAVYIDEGVLSITTDKEPIEMILRLSMVLEYIENKWLMVHFHSSKPEEVESEKDTWGVETWKERAEQLEREVAERTADLVLKNRDLEIEAALERVRASGMAMQSSDELETIIQVVHDQLVELGITLDHAGFIIDYKTNDDMIIWLADEHKVTPQIRLSYFDSPHWNSFITAKEKGHKLFVNHLDFKTKNKFYKQIFKYVPELPEDARSFYLKIPSLTIATSLIDTIGLYIENFSGVQYGEEDQKILLRFGEEFQQAYTRFLDLKKAEAQARESQIQLSLERVRAKSMAMQSSDELHEVIGVVFQQFDNLGIHPVNVFLSLFHREERTLTYRASGKSGKRTPTKQNVDIDSVEAWTDLFNKWINDSSDDIEVIFYPKELVPEIFKLLKETFAAMPKADRMTVEDFPEGGYSTLGYTPFGYIGYDHTRPPTEEEKDILKRICTEFGRVYQRFLDIKKAEAQAREAQIEAALEKVRSRSLAMHHSDEVGEVANILLKKLEELELNIDNEAVIMILSQDGTRNSEMWLASPDIYDSATLFDTPYMGSKLEKALWDKIEESNVDYFTKQFSKKVKNEYFNLAFEHSEFKYLPEDRKQYVLDSETYSYFCALKKYTSIVIPCHTGKLLTTDQIEILKRFSRVLEQAYIRFQDLKKAEAQARESEIQLALERVRASSLAMQSSADLTEVLTVLFSQFNVLGIQPLFAHLTLFDEENNRFSVRMTGRQGQRILAEQYIDVDEVESWKESYIKWQNGQPGDIDCIYYPPEVLGQVLDVLKELNDALPKGSKLHVKDFPDGTYTIQANFEYGYIGFNDDKMATEEQQAIVKRFAKEFSSAYRRFLDIEKAEAQAREAQIETALERVRSASMAMHKTEDISDVVSVLFDQLKDLNVAFKQSWITILHLEKGYFDTWFSPVDGIYDTPQHFRMPDAFFEESIKTWKSRAPLSYLSLKNKEEVDEFIRVCDHITDTNYFSHSRKILNYNQLEILEARHEFGFLSKSNTEVPTKEEKDILQRFAKVFEQAYTRFLDIKKAEAQAREAQIENALEKVRGQSMAMHNSDQLKDVVREIFDQMGLININAEHAGIVVDYEPKKDWHFWVAETQDIPAKISVPYLDSDWDRKFTEAKKNGDLLFTILLNFEEKNAFYEELLPYIDGLTQEMKDGYFKRAGLAISTAIQKDIGLYIENFSGTPYTEEENSILLRFAKVFQQTYTRFLDLKKAEEQAREANIQLALERLRASTMAMKTRGDLLDVIEVFGSQLTSLGINVDTLTVIHGVPKRDWDLWLHTPDSGVPPYRVNIPYMDTPYFTKSIKNIEEYERSGNPIHFKSFDKEEKDEFLTHFFNHAPPIPEEFKALAFAQNQSYAIEAFLEVVTVTLLKYDSENFSEEDIKIFTRFSLEFKQTYTRFLDLKKAEEQARQAQIEVSLERVRSRAMAMHQTDELTNVICVLFDQFDILGINPVLTHLTLFDEENETFSLRITTTAENRIVAEQYIDVNAIDAWKDSFENWKKSEPNAVNCIDYEPEIIPMVFDLLSEVMNALPKGHRIYPKDFPDGLYTTQGHFKFGYIGFNHTRRATEEEKDIVVRFAKEFGRTYQRFLDIEKAEAQSREAQIEAALEKVRSRSLGMQQSNEMQQVANEVHQQLRNLGVDIDAMAMSGVIDNESDYDVWVGGEDYDKPLRIPYNNDTKVQRDYNKAIKERPEHFTKTYKGKTKDAYFEYLMATNAFNSKLKKMMLECSAFTTTLSFMKNSGMQIIRYNDNAFSDEDNSIVKRFGRVFEQAYIRFLDLQKAEAQAREAQIEMALEKVRSRTMAMQTSSELPEAANTLFLEVQALGIPAWSAGYCIWNEDKSLANCNMSSEGEIQKGFMLPSIGEGYDFLSPLEKDEQFHMSSLGGKDLVKHYDFMKTLPGVGEILSELVNAGLELPTFQIFHICYFKHGYVMFITYEPVPKAHDIFKRFTSVFEQTYTRFLDLKQAEAQMRKAQIETSLERVRAKAMSMQNSDELDEVLSVLCEQFDILGIVPMSTHMTVLDIENNTFTFRETGKYGNRSFGEQTVELNAMDNWKETVEKWKADEATAINKLHFPKEQLPEVWKVFHDSFASMPEESRITPDDYPDGIYHTAGKHPFGYIGMNQIRPATKEEEDIVIKFANEFGRAYQRFLDLQKAEAQAREAQIEASLERVRSHSMGMQGTKDFSEVTTEMFNQLRSFGEDLFATGIVFCDKHDGHVEQWHSIPGGSMLSPMIVPIDLDYIHQYRYDQWKAGKDLFSIEIPSDFIKQHFEAIFKLPSAQITLKDLESRNAPMPETPDWEIDYGASFKNGYILISSLKPLENTDILPRFAQVFEQAYTRFLDLKLKEQQARESRIEASLERVRSRTLAMQKSEELAETSVIVFKELLDLGIEPNRLFIGLINESTSKIEAWGTAEDGTKVSTKFVLDTDKNASVLKIVQGWKDSKKYLVIDMKGKVLTDYINYLETEVKVPFSLGLKQKRRVQTIAYFSGGFIGMASNDELPQDTIQLLERFALVFNLTYSRFNDLKISEAQTRKAKIETALERVRARALAMQEPEELKDVASVLRTEMGNLGVEELETCSIYIQKEEHTKAECWYAIKDVRSQGKELVSDYINMDLEHTWVGRKMISLFKGEDDKASIVMTGTKRKEWINYCQNLSKPIQGYYGKDIPDRTYHLFKFSHGAIGAASAGDISQESWSILKRTASVFSLAYSRFRDLTQARIDLQNLQAAKLSAEKALVNLQETQKQLIQSEKMASLGELTAGIAHEIQNPLNFVNNFSEVSKELIEEMLEEMENGDTEEVKAIAMDIIQNLEKINHHGKRADGIVKGMLQHSRASGDKKEATDINALADEYLRLAYHGLRAKDKSFNAQLETDFDDSIGKVNIIPQDIGRVVLNLLTNAFYVVHEKAKTNSKNFEPTVSIKTKKTKDSVILEVKDNGNGMPDSVKEKIFQPFFTTKPTGQGTGLGLSLSYDIITKGHGGTLSLSTQVGEGTTFVISLPK